MDEKQKKKYLFFGLLFTLPFILSAIFSISEARGIDWLQMFIVGSLMDMVFAGAVFVYNKNKPKHEEVDSTEICDRTVSIMFTLRQNGSVVENVMLGPKFMEVEHREKDGKEATKSTFVYSAWGIDGDKTYLHAAKTVRDYLGTDYSIMMAGEYVLINLKKKKAE